MKALDSINFKHILHVKFLVAKLPIKTDLMFKDKKPLNTKELKIIFFALYYIFFKNM